MSSEEEEKPKSRRPKDTKFKQQRLPAWQPILTASTVLPLLFAIGVAFIPLGVAFLITANNVQEKIVDYTYCVDVNNVTCADYLLNNPGATNCTCQVSFNLTEHFKSEVLVYYSLTNYYQNHRRYVKSRDDVQLHGSDVTYKSLSGDCTPYIGNKTSDQPIAPCGAIANSMFNDTLQLLYQPDINNTEKIDLLKSNIAWTTDKNSKFKNPSLSVQNNSLPPPYWQQSVWDIGGYQNEDLMVWMRTAALPSFRKLYRRVNHTGTFVDGLPKGNYTLTVTYTYPVTAFGGTKRLILSTTSWLGGKNPFLGVAYIVVGALCIVIGFIFLIIHLRIGKRSKKARSVELTALTPYYDPSLSLPQINSH